MPKSKPKRKPRAEPAWVPRFLAAFEATGQLGAAARAAGVTRQAVQARRARHPGFAAGWARARENFEACRAAAQPVSPAPADPSLSLARRRTIFLEALAETSSVSASALRASLPLREVYRLRRRDAGFAAAWRVALAEGYSMLEIELLGHLRNPDPAHRMDVASALRLLAAHRETVARERALAEDEDEEAVLAAIDRFIDDMRARREANAPLLALARPAGEGAGGDDAAG